MSVKQKKARSAIVTVLTKDITKQTCSLLGKVIQFRTDICQEVPGGGGGHSGRTRPGTAGTAWSAGTHTSHPHGTLVSIGNAHVAATKAAAVGAHHAAAWGEGSTIRHSEHHILISFHDI